MSGHVTPHTHRHAAPPPTDSQGPVDRWFRISQRGSTYAREIRGGMATFFTMAYIIVLNPIILGGATDKFGHQLTGPQLVTSTALVAAVMTFIMGVGGNLPLAIATGLGLNAVVAFQLAPLMSWQDAMGLVVLEGIVISLLVVTGLREAVMYSIPQPLKQAISVGIGLFIAFIGFIDAGFITRIPGDTGTVPVQLGDGGRLIGWPVVVFCIGVLLTVALMARKIRGALLIGILSMTALAIVINEIVDINPAAWGVTEPRLPDDIVAAPDFGLLGSFSLFGAFEQVGIITVVLLVFTLVLSDFFDTMGTIVGVTNEAGLLDERGRVPNLGRVLLIDGAAAIAGGAASSSSSTSYIESAAGVGEGARTGLASVVTGGLFAVALFLTPLATVVPAQAAAPALIVVGFLLMSQVRHIDWEHYEIAIPAFLTITVMPFTYSITNGIGAGFIAYAVIQTVLGRARAVHPLMWGTSLLFAIYFAIEPVEQLLGVK
ncbi:NCS2 family permease [Streptomyces sp. NPDC047108]|uniref:NCS2 family permease n=1 Tax=Streptomyces sp. NPDC047108 TaxID=3155025 RepID=UPI0033F645F9